MASDADVEELARWMHETHRSTTGKTDLAPWDELFGHSQADVAAVARQLLDNPPDVLKRAVRWLKPSVEPTGAGGA